MNLAEIKSIAFAQMANNRSHSWKERGNKYYHGERVAKLAVTLRKLIFPDHAAYDGILTVAAWFHDIRNGENDHAEKGADVAAKLLGTLCNDGELEEICKIIAVHDDRTSDRALFSDWVKLHQDADLLDHFGTFDVWMTFLYAVPHDQTILEVREFLVNERPSENVRYGNELNFDISKLIYNDKIQFLVEFTERFAAESIGEIWNMDKITAGYGKYAEKTKRGG